ncbi:MAG: permease [Deltaproteobacteria bacterium]
MKAAALLMLLVVLGLGAACLARGGAPLLVAGLRASGRSALPLIPVLVVVFLMAGFVEVLLPREVVTKWLSDSAGFRGMGIAMVAGALTPGGGPMGLPLAAALMRAGAGAGVLVTYLTSMSLLSFIRVPMELAIYGTRLTVLRLCSSAALPLLAGLIAQSLSRWR